jgi:hypothetical protein
MTKPGNYADIEAKMTEIHAMGIGENDDDS